MKGSPPASSHVSGQLSRGQRSQGDSRRHETVTLECGKWIVLTLGRSYQGTRLIRQKRRLDMLNAATPTDQLDIACYAKVLPRVPRRTSEPTTACSKTRLSPSTSRTADCSGSILLNGLLALRSLHETHCLETDRAGRHVSMLATPPCRELRNARFELAAEREEQGISLALPLLLPRPARGFIPFSSNDRADAVRKRLPDGQASLNRVVQCLFIFAERHRGGRSASSPFPRECMMLSRRSVHGT